MVQFSGTYESIDSINPEEFIKIVGKEATKANIKALVETQAFMNVQDKQDHYVITVTLGSMWQRIIRFKLNERFVESGSNTTVTKEDDKLIFSSVDKYRSFKRIYEFFDFGLVVTLITDTGTGVMKFRRI